MKWQNKLTKKQLKHLKDVSCVVDKSSAIRNAEHQNTEPFPCWDCVEIGRRLGVNMPLTAWRDQANKMDK